MDTVEPFENQRFQRNAYGDLAILIGRGSIDPEIQLLKI